MAYGTMVHLEMCISLAACGNSAETTANDAANSNANDEIATPEPTEAPCQYTYTEEITKETTCEEDGVKTLTCECGESHTEVISATGHVFDYMYNEDATYLADGNETATCANCDATDTLVPF